MVDLDYIQATFVTGSDEAAGTDGAIYLGICGREFCCDRKGGDFEPGQKSTYRFGSSANVIEPIMNDPREPKLQVEDADLFPVYVRFDQGTASHWQMRSVEVALNGKLSFSSKMPDLWMGHQAGAFCYLRKNRG